MQRLLRYIAWLFASLASSSATPVHAGGEPPSYAPAFELAFQPGWQTRLGDRSVAFRIFNGGQLRLTSGRVKACDPFVGMEHRPFTPLVPEGDFPVRLALVDGGVDDSRVAFARVDFSPSPVVRWEMAVTEGQDIATLKEGEHFGYPVDAGTGSFVDAATAAIAAQRMAADEGIAQSWIDLGEKGGSGNGAPNFYANIDIGPGNIIMFQSGWGDGLYASWFGYDAQGRIAVLLTDFNVVDWSKAKW
jgi:uncharacterized protein DUF4241